MAIPFSRYVMITSGVGAGATVPRRDFILRLYTQNTLVPTESVVEFTSANDVGEYFGTTSAEFLRTQPYFGFLSKNTTRPKRIAFARWANTDTAPQVFGAMHGALAAFTAISAGTMTVTIGGSAEALTGIDLSSDSSFTDVAATIQTAVRTGTGTVFTGATVTYNAPDQRFELTGGETGAATITIAAGASNDVAGLLGWLTGAIVSNGVAAETVTETLADSAEMSNNFGSFAFIPTLTEEQITEAATWNSTQNVLYMFLTGVLPADAAAVSANLINLAGTGITLASATATNEYPELLPAAIQAATDYRRRASVQNYMFQFANLMPTVTTNAGANLYDGLRINYYGQTQTAGQNREFYQRGVLTGGPTAPVDMNTYANEQWLKDDAGVRIMNLLLSLARVSANQRGRGQLLSTIQGSIDQALLNGTISVGRAINDTQRIFITEATDDERAWQQVQTSGYWVDVEIESRTTSDGRTEFIGSYLLIYAKDDVIRAVEGTHTLI